MAAALYMLVPGNSFIYYGEELGLTQDSSQSADEYKREPMIWDSKNLPEIHIGGVTTADESQCAYGGVKQQQGDSDSIFSFYRDIIKIKNSNHGIARGKLELNTVDDSNVLSYKIVNGDETLIVFHNLSKEESKSLSLSSDCTIKGALTALGSDSGKVTISGKTLNLPPFSSAVLKVS